jgi:transposase
MQSQMQQLDLWLDFPAGSRFTCPQCERDDCGVYDTTERTWRHLNFFQHKTFLHARQPRITCPDHGVKTVAVPWARPGAGFTLLMEAFVLLLVQGGMTPTQAGRMIDEHDTRLWRILQHYVEKARSEADFSEVTAIGVDETGRRRGHNYLTVFMDLDEGRRRVLFATEGKDASTVARFREDLEAHGGRAEQPETFDVLRKSKPATVKAMQIKSVFQDLFALDTAEEAEPWLRRWYFWATHSRIDAIIKAAKTIKEHWDGVLRWFTSRISNGVVEAINGLIQSAKARARGFASTRYLITMVYLIAGKLDFKLPAMGHATHTK